ncbi:unnamed protein product [Lactuca saligna]|uniref:Aquaporin n=1 Tax=Lactuca saligna TaxID=75948 RepID=A0AA35YUH0_LACSI|nr:unnamed protein product [Lactuca saligna]
MAISSSFHNPHFYSLSISVIVKASSGPRYVVGFITNSILMSKQVGELAGIAVGATVMLNILIAVPLIGASMNPARTLGPAIVVLWYVSILPDCKNVIFNTSKVVAQKSVGDASTFVESEFSLSSSSWSWYVEKTAHSWFCNCLVSQKIVPKLTEVLTDTHPQVQSAWQITLQQSKILQRRLQKLWCW